MLFAVGLLSAGALALWFVSTTTQKNIARAVAAHAYYDVATSALAEVNARIMQSCMAQEQLAGVDFGRRLGPAYPPPAVTVEPVLTKKLAAELHPEMTVGDVTIAPLGRDMPGERDPLIGMLELTVRVEGRAGGWSLGREVTQRVTFFAPCATWRTEGPGGSFRTPTWGTATIQSYADAQQVKNL